MRWLGVASGVVAVAGGWPRLLLSWLARHR
jgi:hypothetical protein